MILLSGLFLFFSDSFLYLSTRVDKYRCVLHIIADRTLHVYDSFVFTNIENHWNSGSKQFGVKIIDPGFGPESGGKISENFATTYIFWLEQKPT